MRQSMSNTPINKITHGEAYVLKRENISFKETLEEINNNLQKLPKRMPRNKASKYYTEKFKKYWNNRAS